MNGGNVFRQRRAGSSARSRGRVFGGEVHFFELVGPLAGGFPTDLATEAGFVASGTNVLEFPEEMEEDGFEEVPVFGAGGEEAGDQRSPPISSSM